ncbi:MAG: lecithin retinol acyltransferase family protein [Gemmataceae bacterium]|nr:lecithin retinol acyltransferase family protein [Gemmataceae bacterium]MDW8267267.1 lecithin retinol acyltransferase family protein [Gemmataceae bacterium]
MARADHLVVSYGPYTHHGIDIGDGTVVHLSKANGSVKRVSYSEFVDGRPTSIRKYDGSDPPKKVVARALSCVGKRGYNLFTNNCEHFATWCKTGHAESSQVNAFRRAVTRAAVREAVSAFTWGAAGEIASVAARAAAGPASRAAAKSIARAATPWLLLGDALQLGTEVLASTHGADPDDAALIGRGVGLASSATIGFACGGPVGALVGVGLWGFGEFVGSLFS